MGNEQGQRKKWEFQYSANELAKAAKRMVDYHAEREAYWLKEQDAIAAVIEQQTVVVHRREVTGGKQISVEIDQEPASRLNTIEYKLRTHRAAKFEFQKWHTLFSHDDSNLIRHLDSDDLEYFRIGMELPNE